MTTLRKNMERHDRVLLIDTPYTGRVVSVAPHPIYGAMVTVDIDQQDLGLEMEQLVMRVGDLARLYPMKGQGATITERNGAQSAWTIMHIVHDVMALRRDRDGEVLCAHPYGKTGNRWLAANERFVQYGVRLERPADV